MSKQGIVLNVVVVIPPPCVKMTELFYGPDVDGRRDKERDEREARAKFVCTAQCPYRWDCLERTSLYEFGHAANGVFGVAGGMAEGERQRFYIHLRGEGYEQVPEATEFVASVSSFYRAEMFRKLKKPA